VKHVALLLHYYQPPTQDPEMVRRIDGECYAPSFGLLARTGARVTVNINWSLTEQLQELDSPSLGSLRRAGGIEPTGSGAYHPILPLIPPAEVERQLELNAAGNGSVLGEAFARPRGVFPPEMALDDPTARLLAGLGYAWTVTDDLPWHASGRDVPGRWIPSAHGMAVVMRSNLWSNRVSFHPDDGAATAREILDGMDRWNGGSDSYLLLAMDGETFGHHHPRALGTFLEPFVEAMDAAEDGRLSTVSEIVDRFPFRRGHAVAGSWSTTAADVARGVPFPLWKDPANPDHTALWELLEEVLRWARECGGQRVASLADRMLYSCPFWWASTGRRSPTQVRRGVLAILRTALAALDETHDVQRMDRVMAMACAVPAMTGEE